MKLFHCGALYTPWPEPVRTCLLVADDGRVLDTLTPAQAAAVTAAEVTDLRQCSVGPGLVDVHCHGAMGSDFADGTVEDISRAARYHLSRGTTTLLAGIGSCSTAEMLRACASVRELGATVPNLAGVHLEGPYFSRDWYGCHQESMIRGPTPEEWRQFAPWRDVIRWCTLAPELPGALDFIREYAAGTVFSIGHSKATYDEIRRAIDAGLRHSTHVFNAMPKAERRDLVLEPGVLESVLLLDELTTEIIGDGIHVGARLVELVQRIKGTRGCALVSDALRGVGCGPGDYAFGPRNGKLCRIVESPRVGVVPDRPGVLASSAITLADSLRVLSQATRLSLSTLWEMASTTPARILGVDARKGSLRPGRDADLLALGQDLEVSAVFVRGQAVGG
jgi:N-acetylglucosamine-6-phosphate deacetylase